MLKPSVHIIATYLKNKSHFTVYLFGKILHDSANKSHQSDEALQIK